MTVIWQHGQLMQRTILTTYDYLSYASCQHVELSCCSAAVDWKGSEQQTAPDVLGC